MNSNTETIKGRGQLVPPFDIALYLFTFLAPIFFWLPLNLNMVQSMFFVFGTLALFGISFFCKKQRELDNKILGFLILWSLASIFIHTIKLALLNSPIYSTFINFCLMSEGFIYVLCGCLLYYLVYCFSDKFDLFYPILSLNIINLVFAISQKLGYRWIWMNNQSISGMMGVNAYLTIFSAFSIPILLNRYIKGIWYPFILIPLANLILGFNFTGILSIFLAIAIYLKLTYQKERFYIWLFLGAVFILLNKNILWHKFIIRLDIWYITLKDILKHPFLGWGFDNSLNSNMVYSIKAKGLAFRHNDLLNVTRDLGIPFALAIFIFVKKIFMFAKKDYLWVAGLSLFISSMVWTSFYFARIASLGIVTMALLSIKNEKDYETV